jgi:hypothetical protein
MPKNGKVSLHSHPVLSTHDTRRVAVFAQCDPRCVVKYLRAIPIQSTTRSRIEEALRKCDLAHLIADPKSYMRPSARPAGAR